MNSNVLYSRSQAVVWHPCTQMKLQATMPPLTVARGEGVWLYDPAGVRYLDAISSWWVNLFGHANPRINAALINQLQQIEHVMLAGCTHEPVVNLSEQLVQLSGLAHVFYASDGASATEIALKMSFHTWHNHGKTQKTGFISIKQGYHGETLGALSVTDVAVFKDVYAPLLRHSVQVMSPDWRLAEVGESAEDYALRAAADLDETLQRIHTQVAALIIEPLVQCAGGMAMHHPAYLRRVRQLCDAYRIHMIADEIAVGFGRTGSMFAYQQAGIVPDLLCLSKGITAGYLPLSAVLSSEAIYQAFYSDQTVHGFLHSHSYTGNPLACCAANASLAIFAQDDVLNCNQRKAARAEAITLTLRQHSRVQHFRHLGMIWAFDVSHCDEQFAQRMHQAALARGVLLRPIGHTVYLMPPYVISDEELEHLFAVTLAALNDVIR